MMESTMELLNPRDVSLAAAGQASITWPAAISGPTSGLLRQMFRDPRVLESNERRDLVTELRTAVELEPNVAEFRVLLGMALCVDLQPQEAMEHLRQATQQAPACFIARLKFGELLMRLRICRQAEEETHKAAQLASNDFQADLARKQAATIRTMLQNGVERGGYRSFLERLTPKRGRSKRTESVPQLAGSK